MLLDIHLELGPPAKSSATSRSSRRSGPAEEIPFAKIVKVGAAYHDMGEYERSYLVFRATVESSFLRESGVAGFLEAQGEFARSVEVMGRLLREYPPEAYVAAAELRPGPAGLRQGPRGGRRPQARASRRSTAWTWSAGRGRMLEGFLTAYPDDPAADQAAFAAANALLELKDYKEAAAACNRYAKRYPKSDLLDSYWYIIGYCHFATGQHQAALEMCRKVAEAKRIDQPDRPPRRKAPTSGRRSTSSARSTTAWARPPRRSASTAAWRTASPTPSSRSSTSSARRSSCPR